MDNDYKELVEFLGEKFDKIDQRFEKIDQRFEKIDQQFVDVKSQILDVKETLETKADKEDVNNLLNAVDAYAHKADSYFQEMVMLSRKVDRHEKWFQQVANKLGINLEY